MWEKKNNATNKVNIIFFFHFQIEWIPILIIEIVSVKSFEYLTYVTKNKFQYLTL